MSTALATTTNQYIDDGLPGTTIRGKLIKYAKGKWKAGQENDPVALGTKFVVIIDEVTRGYLRWENKRLTGQKMVKISDGPKPARAECGENDKATWPIDLKTGKAKDPWQETFQMFFVDAKGNVYTFSASSAGAIGAYRRLATEYGNLLLRDQSAEDKYPLIAIGTDSYDHDEYGEVNVPVLKMIGVVPKTTVAAAFAAGIAGSEEDEYEPEHQENPGDGMDDEIPF